MTKKNKLLIIGASVIGGIAIITPLSIIANQMISSNSILKLKSVKKNGDSFDNTAKHDFTGSGYRYGHINCYFLTLTFNHPISQTTVANVDDTDKYDDNGQAQLVWTSQNKCCFWICSFWEHSVDSSNDYPVPTNGGKNATTVEVQYNSQHFFIEFKWSFEYLNKYQNSSYRYSAASRVMEETIKWTANPISL